jgi:glycine/D-amino acid oxidase-like deaminating enzyme
MQSRATIPVGQPVVNPLPSYWHDPKSPLAKLIEPHSSEPFDYCIIGSGITGTMTAHFLLESYPSSRIIMLEARSVCSGATGRNGGHTKAASYRSYVANKADLGKEEALKIARMEYANIDATHGLVKELNLGAQCESQMCDTIDVIYDRETFEAGKRAIAELAADANEAEREEGELAWYQVIEKEDVMKQNFNVSRTNTNPVVQGTEEVVGAFRYRAGRIHAYRFSTSILNSCTRKGLVLCTQTPVHAIRPSTTSSLWDVHTQFSTVSAHKVILATNGYTPSLLPAFQGAIVPMRGQITAQRAPDVPSPLPTTYSFIYKNGYEYMIPRPLSTNNQEQHIIIGGGLGRLPHAGSSEYGTVDDSALNSQISVYLAGSVAGYFDTADAEVVQEWSGIMGATSDGLPFVGDVPGMPGVWVAAGFNGHGMVLCLKSAEALVARIKSSAWPEWWPRSFGVSGERLSAVFGGRRDMKTAEGHE